MLKEGISALAGEVPLVESCPVHQNVTGPSPSQGTFLGLWAESLEEGVHEAAEYFPITWMFLSLHSSLSKKNQ